MECIAGSLDPGATINPISCGEPGKRFTGRNPVSWLFDNCWPGSSCQRDLVGDGYPGHLPDNYGLVQANLSPAVRWQFNSKVDVTNNPFSDGRGAIHRALFIFLCIPIATTPPKSVARKFTTSLFIHDIPRKGCVFVPQLCMRRSVSLLQLGQ